LTVAISNIDLVQSSGLRGIGRKLADGTPKCEELRCGDEVLFAVVDRHGHPAWLSTAAGVSPILVMPIQKAFAALKRSGTLTVIFLSLLSFAFTRLGISGISRVS